ncbi:methyltransferase [Mycobacterium paraense]
MTKHLPAVARMHEMLSGFVLSQAIFAVAELDVATALLDGPRRIDELAAAVGADPDALRRIIRFLAQHGVFRASAGTVEITDLGRTLADRPRDSLRKAASYFRRTHYPAFDLLHTARTGDPAATSFLGKPFFQWIDDNADLAELQNEAMAGFTRIARGDLLDVYQLPDGEVAADIGGADGSLLVDLLARRPRWRGIVYDLPRSVAAARATIQAAGLGDRVEIVAGDFFRTVPAADVYVLSAVLQDWSDFCASRILRNVRAAAAPHSRLVVIDMVAPEDDVPHAGTVVDITMLAMLGGRWRSRSEWDRLLAGAGFCLRRIVSGSGSHFALEATLR